MFLVYILYTVHQKVLNRSAPAFSAEEHVDVRVRLLRQHRHLPLHPHHPPVQSHHGQKEHPGARQVSPHLQRTGSRTDRRQSEPGPAAALVSSIKPCVCFYLGGRYWEAVLELLWPRFEMILEMNIHSIRNTDPQKLGVLDTRPHYVRALQLHTQTNTDGCVLAESFCLEAGRRTLETLSFLHTAVRFKVQDIVLVKL